MLWLLYSIWPPSPDIWHEGPVLCLLKDSEHPFDTSEQPVPSQRNVPDKRKKQAAPVR